MKIAELRILPPIAIGRLGSSVVPMAAYDLVVPPQQPLDFREVVPQTTFTIDKDSGEVTAKMPDHIRFKDAKTLASKDGKVRPVAPFLEVFAITSERPDELVPLTEDLLRACGQSIADIRWDVLVGNIKVFRRTNDPGDKIMAAIDNINTHEVKKLQGKCPNFRSGRTLPLGTVQFVKPTVAYPGIRFRFTPAGGKVYGSSTKRHTSATQEEDDPIITNDKLVLYDTGKGKWRGYKEGSAPNPVYTNPAQIFAGYSDADGAQVSWGYLDDECDGFVTVSLLNNKANPIKASAHISAGPPAFAPDTLPIRVVSDELEQIILGTEREGAVSIEEAEEILRRAFETIRLMNTAVMNGNSYDGKFNVASTMVRQDTNDFGRLFEPIMATSLVDNIALQVLHERVYNGLATGASPWFGDVLRRPNEIGDLSNEARRKMPALMRGADGRTLCFTWRQINTIIKAAAGALFDRKTPPLVQPKDAPMKAANLTAQLHYRGEGNPIAVLPRTAISNCFPGLEFDFRNLWRRAFKGVVLIENNNYVVEQEEPLRQPGPDGKPMGLEINLVGHRLVAIEGQPTMVSTSGPVFPNGPNNPLITTANPNGVSFMEWSNSMVQVLQKQGQVIMAHFTTRPSKEEVVVDMKELNDKEKYIEVPLIVNHIFEGKSAALSDTILRPGELTQGLCAPWQNDYRECACYYWAASRPDFVNVVPDEKGLATGDSWMAKRRTGKYIPDDRTDSRLLSYDDLFANWEGELSFLIKGRDALQSEDRAVPLKAEDGKAAGSAKKGKASVSGGQSIATNLKN
jgi:hypothetical protein